jgi:hypothetical protein
MWTTNFRFLFCHSSDARFSAICGTMLSKKYRAANFSPVERASVTGKPRGHQKMVISTFAVEMMCLALVGAISPRASYIWSESL